ncbi:cytidylyltransferase domain-containing protein [Virgibacillus byunsanensis]|uniref:Cytidylyltransferase domain-containing protein n=1 Tax=Virgibacillus byunsanensis TaxID=570945 RepID=A0ABW3LGL6_9BACI
MCNIAIIPARSGSQGLKDKNIKLLNGKIEAAKDSKLFARIVQEWGASVPFLWSYECYRRCKRAS